MGSNRVIQDSDDEDPLSCEAHTHPPPTLNQPDIPDDIDENNGPDDVNGNCNDGTGGMSVNFDDFLQSQSQDAAAQARISSSQERREERWIPNGGGIARGSGSIGFVMSEIGLAQRRLFDDDAEQQLPPTAQFSESGPTGSAYFHEQQGGEVGMEDNNHLGYPTEYSGSYAQVQVPMPPDWYHPTLQDGGGMHGDGLDQANSVEANGSYYDAPHTSASSYDHTQSTASYNVFASLDDSRYTDGRNATTMHNETIETEILRRTPNRSKSIPIQLYSPHDTEPLSSLVSNVSRSKSDNVGQQNTPQQQSPTNASDELSAPVAIEIPVMQRNSRKKKQLQPEEEEDDELAAPNDYKSAHEANPEKRSPVRPRDNVRAMDKEPSETYDQTETKAPHLGPSDATPQNTNPENDKIQLAEVDVPIRDTFTFEREQIHVPEPTKPTTKKKETKKKKLKRGKTTSATLKRTREPDVEDDVIWVDEQPSNPDFQHGYQPTSIPTPDSISAIGEERDVMTATMVEIPNPVPVSIAEGDQEEGSHPAMPQPDPIPVPKKRGRKRKKTSEQLAAEEEANAHASAQPDSNISIVLDDEPPEPPVDNPENIQEQQLPSSPTKQPPASELTSNGPETPKKQTQNVNVNASGSETSTKIPNTNTNNNDNKGPDKHSPIAGTSKVPYRVGLSRRARIAPLLKVVRK